MRKEGRRPQEMLRHPQPHPCLHQQASSPLPPLLHPSPTWPAPRAQSAGCKAHRKHQKGRDGSLLPPDPPTGRVSRCDCVELSGGPQRDVHV